MFVYTLARFCFLLAVLACAESKPLPIAPPPSVEREWIVLSPSPSPPFQAVAFGGAGEATITPESITLARGEPLTGIRFAGEFKTTDYEVEVEAARMGGNDFFCALTLPLGGSHATIVLGGWGGSLTGISCVDELDASSNPSKSFQRYERGVFYALRVAVTEKRLVATLRDTRESSSAAITLFDLDTSGHTFSLRPEVERCRPLGLATYNTTAVIRRIAWRDLEP